MIVAFALPGQHFMAIDYSKMGVHPFTLYVTLKHEMCHLMLGSYIKGRLPRWVDEGVAQWVTGGLSEVMAERRGSALAAATASRRLIRLEDLAETFPGNRESLILAYEESRSVIEYISRRYGKEEILEILGRMRNGEALADAIRDVMPVTLAQLEEDWHDDLMERATWFFLVADNVYEILFFLPP